MTRASSWQAVHLGGDPGEDAGPVKAALGLGDGVAVQRLARLQTSKAGELVRAGPALALDFHSGDADLRTRVDLVPDIHH